MELEALKQMLSLLDINPDELESIITQIHKTKTLYANFTYFFQTALYIDGHHLFRDVKSR